jgi:hypothetical protein
MNKRMLLPLWGVVEVCASAGQARAASPILTEQELIRAKYNGGYAPVAASFSHRGGVFMAYSPASAR